MRISIGGNMLLVGACLVAAASARGQQPQDQAAQIVDSLDVAVVYSPVRANMVGGYGFWMQGGSVQVYGQFWRGHSQFWQRLGVVADVSGLHAAHMNGTGVGLDMVTADFGPRYTWSPANHRYAIFGEAKVGEAHGMRSIFPVSAGLVDSANSLAFSVGGGLNIPITRRLSARAFEAEWLRTQMPNGATGVQNNVRLGVGLIFKFKWPER
jgi:hypothetical protein